MRLAGGRLTTRMVIAFGGLLAGIGAFMVGFFPRGMSEQAQQSTETRALAITTVISTAIAPAIEFEDAEHASTILAWLTTTEDARFAVLRGPSGATFATWGRERVPSSIDWPSSPGVALGGRLVIASVPVSGMADATGMLHIGFSLDALERERDRLVWTATIASAIVVGIGLLATLLAATLIVRPIRRLTVTAQQVGRGDLPPELPRLRGPGEISELAAALQTMLERVHQQNQQELLRASRHAGMAEVATGVLHNVGNILNSVNVTVELLREGVRGGGVDRMRQLHQIVTKLEAGSVDAKQLAALAQFVEVIRQAHDADRTATLAKLDSLRSHIDHIKRVVAMQNAYARQNSVVETARLGDLVNEAVEIALPASRRGKIAVDIDVSDDAQLAIDRHRVLQIVVNLIANARDAVADAETQRIAIAGRVTDGKLAISVRDSGVGFTPETAKRLFGAGFTTKPRGHGYGLHSSALAAQQLGGELTADSPGSGLGATFTLVLPLSGGMS